MEANPYYINPDGKIVEYEGIASHIGIAMQVIEDDPKMKEEFKNSNFKYATDFLIQKRGFIQVTDDAGNGYYQRKLLFSASKMSQAQKRIIMELIAEGFTYENIDETEKEGLKQFHDFEL